MTWFELEIVRMALYKAIMILFHDCERGYEDDLCFYRKVAAYFVYLRMKSGQDSRPFSIISLNWDCILENSIYWCLEKLNTKKVDVDYCCYTHPFEKRERHTRSIIQRAIEIYNIKTMKLHGSVNWMLCPNCNRLYVGLGAAGDELYEYTIEKECPRCKHIFVLDNKGPILEPFLISPTYVKQFDNAHIQMIWHNAYMDLCRAEKVVFIGYSLPEADYHLRTLLKRSIKENIKIDIVLARSDKAPKSKKLESIRHKYASSRYETFFGTGENVKFFFNGVQDYFKKETKKPIVESIEGIRKKYKNILNSMPLDDR